MVNQKQTSHHLRIRRVDDRLLGESIEQEHRLRRSRVHPGGHHPRGGSDTTRSPTRHQA